MQKSNYSQGKTAINRALTGISQESLCAHDLKYTFVYDNTLKTMRSTQEIIGYNLDYALELRHEARSSSEENARFRCIICNGALVLLSTSEKSGFYFKHKHQNHDCPLKDENNIPANVLRAHKFNGKQESIAHLLMKYFLLHILSKDERFSDIELEKTRINEFGERRRPDVSAKFFAKNIVFEVQLSTESLDVIEARRNFYKKEGTLLVWVFHEFSFDKARVSDLDIYSLNNNNILVLNEQAVIKSILTKKLHLTCYWSKPHIINDSIVHDLYKGIFDFEELQKDFGLSQIFHYNFKTENRKTQEYLFKKLWRTDIDICNYTSSSYILKKCFGIQVKENYYRLPKLLHAIWIARTKRKSGWKYEPIQVFNLLFDSHKDLMLIFIIACEVYGFNLQGKNTDVEKKKREVFESILSSKTSPYWPPTEHIEIVERVFPTLYQRYVDKIYKLGPEVSNDWKIRK